MAQDKIERVPQKQNLGFLVVDVDAKDLHFRLRLRGQWYHPLPVSHPQLTNLPGWYPDYDWHG